MQTPAVVPRRERAGPLAAMMPRSGCGWTRRPANTNGSSRWRRAGSWPAANPSRSPPRSSVGCTSLIPGRRPAERAGDCTTSLRNRDITLQHVTQAAALQGGSSAPRGAALQDGRPLPRSRSLTIERARRIMIDAAASRHAGRSERRYRRHYLCWSKEGPMPLEDIRRGARDMRARVLDLGDHL